MWFRPRATYDVDFTVLLRREEASRFIGCLGQEYVPLQSDPTQALRRSGVLFVRDESAIRLDLQLADVGFDDSAIQRTVEIELKPGRICTAGLNASFRTKSRSSKSMNIDNPVL